MVALAVVTIGTAGCAFDGGADAWRVDATAAIEIGAADGEALYLLARVTGATDEHALETGSACRHLSVQSLS